MDLKTARQLKNMTQEAMAKELGVSQVALSAWETGRNAVPKQRQQQIEGIFGWPIDFSTQQPAIRRRTK